MARRDNAALAEARRRLDAREVGIEDLRRVMRSLADQIAFEREARESGRLARFRIFLFMALSFLLILGVTVLLMEPVQTALGAWLTEVLGIDPAEITAGTAPAVAAPEAAPGPGGALGRIGYTDFITLCLAISAGGIAYMASMMGMKRLEAYDDQFNLFRSERREFERTLRDDNRSRIEETIRTNGEKLESDARDALESIGRGIEEKLQSKSERVVTEARDYAEALSTMMSEFEAKFGPMAQGESFAALRENVGSVSSAREEAGRRREANDEKGMRDVIRYALATLAPGVTPSERIAGERDDWFNLGAFLGRANEYALALDVTMAGLYELNDLRRGADGLPERIEGREPYNDLLSHALQYSVALGNWPLADRIARIMSEAPDDERNWRYFQFLSTYYRRKGDETRYFELVEEYERLLPHDERPENLRIEWHQDRNDWQAIDAILDDILSKPELRINAVATRLAQVALARGRYDDVIAITDRGLVGGAEAQPNTFVGSLLFMRGNAFDSKLLTLLAGLSPGEEHGPGVEAAARSLYRRAVLNYSNPMVSTVSLHVRPAQERQMAMRVRLEEAGFDPSGWDAGSAAPREGGAPEGGAPAGPPQDHADAVRAQAEALFGAVIGALQSDEEPVGTAFEQLAPVAAEPAGQVVIQNLERIAKEPDVPDALRERIGQLLARLRN